MTRTKCQGAGEDAAKDLGITLVGVVMPEPWSKKLIAYDKREAKKLEKIKQRLAKAAAARRRQMARDAKRLRSKRK
jgi:hypothetical protein